MCTETSTVGRHAAASKKTGAAKGKAATKEKEQEKYSKSGSVADQFNTAMPHFTLRIVSDTDAAVSLYVDIFLPGYKVFLRSLINYDKVYCNCFAFS